MQTLDARAQPASVSCGQCKRSATEAFFRTCVDCRGDVRFNYPVRDRSLPRSPQTMWDFADRLPVRDARNIVSLGEGMTPLLQARSYPQANVYWKYEGINPTGSQKDRAVSVAISVAKEHRFERVVTASTGSVGLSCAAYCARAGMPCVILMPTNVPVERVRPMLAYGAKALLVDATFEDIEHVLDELDPARWYQASTIQRRNCYQSEGPKTIAYEIVIQMDGVPDWVVVPIGGGGSLFGIWKGFEELRHDGLTDRTPRMLGVQARSFNFFERTGVLASIDEKKLASLVPDERTETLLRNLKHGFPPDAHGAMRALHETSGRVLSVTDDEALAAQLALARGDGIFCEPSSAASVVAIERALEQEWIRPDERVIGIITGSGLREPGVLSRLDPLRVKSVDEAALERLVAAGCSAGSARSACDADTPA